MTPHNGGTIRRMKIGCYYQITFVCICSIFRAALLFYQLITKTRMVRKTGEDAELLANALLQTQGKREAGRSRRFPQRSAGDGPLFRPSGFAMSMPLQKAFYKFAGKPGAFRVK